LRCFVAAFLEPGAGARLSRLVPEIEGFTPVARKNLHVTLLFLGERTEDQAYQAWKCVQALSAEPLRCELMALTGLPRPGRATVQVAELHPHPALTRWHAALTDGVGPADRPFRPHVTVARSRRPRVVATLPLSPTTLIQLRPPALYRSETLATGARYSELTFS
jgi:2'-5' RNA ligase